MRLLLLITLFLLISISSASAQAESWLPVGEGLPGRALHAAVGEDGLYVVHQAPHDSGLIYAISKWDESSWTRVADIDKDLSGNDIAITSLIVYKGDLYISGYFELDSFPSEKRGIARWDGRSWQPVGGGIDDNYSMREGIDAMIEYKGDLYCTGGFTSIGGIKANSIARWDGTRWHPLGTGLVSMAHAGWMGHALAVYKDELYVGGAFDQAGDIPVGDIARWNGEEWNAAGNQTSHLILKMIVYNDELYAIGRVRQPVVPPAIGTDIVRWNGSTWKGVETIPTDEPPFTIQGCTVFNGKLYVGAWELSENVARFDGTQWEIFPGLNGYPSCLISYNGQLYAGGTFTQSNGNHVKYIARLCDASSCGMISGNVFHDINSNCIIDKGEQSLAQRIIEVTPGPYYVTLKTDGSYAQYVPPGTYDVKLTPRAYWNQICPPTSAGYSVTLATGDNAKEKNFGLRPDANMRDVRVSVVSGRARPGLDLTYAITYENVGTVPVDGTVRFQHDPSLTFVTSAPPQARSAGNIIEWDFTNLAVDESRTINVTMRVPQSTAFGTKLCGSVEVDLDQLDLRMHQRDTFCIDVTRSYDPNDIAVTPFGIEENGEISPEDSILTYTVRFQNTGNDTAFKVVVVDTLSSHLDVSSIVPGAASHPFSFAISGKGVVAWTFDNILLPDSGASEPNSHGFFKYTIRQRRHLPLGTEIPNRADIYFDYNAPVATNTVVSIIGTTSNVPLPVDPVDVTIYPNPAKESIHLRGMLSGNERVELRDMLGNRVNAALEWMGTEAMLDLRGIPSGTYFVAIATKHGTMLQHITVAR